MMDAIGCRRRCANVKFRDATSAAGSFIANSVEPRKFHMFSGNASIWGECFDAT